LASEQPARSRPPSDLPAPQGFGDLLKNTWTQYRTNFLPLFILFIPLGAAFFIAIAPLLIFSGDSIGTGAADTSLSTSVTLAVLTVLPIIVGGIGVATGTVLVTDRLVGYATTAPGAFRKIRPHLSALFVAGLASSLLSILLQLVLPPFAFFMHPLLYGPAIVVQVIALEGADLKVAMARAGKLLGGEKVRVFANLFAVSLGVSILNLLLPGLAGTALNAISNEVVSRTAGTLLEILVTAALVPLVAVAMLVAYFDLRARKENLDSAELATERGVSD
jgi:hypothetical protein